MKWEEIIKQMPVLFEELQKAPLVERADVQRSFHFKEEYMFSMRMTMLSMWEGQKDT